MIAQFFLPFGIAFAFLELYKIIGYRYSVGIQQLREDGPQQHFMTKKHTLTMGGLFIIMALLVHQFYIGSAPIELIALILFGLIGLIDDVLKVLYKTNKTRFKRGLSAKTKLLLQLGAAALCSYFLPNKNILWIMFFIGGVSNAVNISDGLDGLITVPLIFCFGFYFLLFSSTLYLAIMAILAAFLCFNYFPAKIFIGDVGSLGFGALLAFIALKTNTELFLMPLGFIFLVEIFSVIIQVLYMKKTKKRIFLMAPIHHHFEQKGYQEKQIVWFIWIMQLFLSILSYYLYTFLI